MRGDPECFDRPGSMASRPGSTSLFENLKPQRSGFLRFGRTFFAGSFQEIRDELDGGGWVFFHYPMTRMGTDGLSHVCLRRPHDGCPHRAKELLAAACR